MDTLSPDDPTLTLPWTPHEHPLLDPACEAWRALVHEAAARHGIPRPSDELRTLKMLDHSHRKALGRGLEVAEVLTAVRARAALREPVEQWQVVDTEQLVKALLEDGDVWPLPLAGASLMDHGGDGELEAATDEEYVEDRPVGLPILPASPLHLRLHPRHRALIARHGHPNPRGRVLIRWTAREYGYLPIERRLDELESAPVYAPGVVRVLCRREAAIDEWRMVLADL